MKFSSAALFLCSLLSSTPFQDTLIKGVKAEEEVVSETPGGFGGT
jgi:hypothetical protein